MRALRWIIGPVVTETTLPAEVAMTILRVHVGLAMAIAHGWGKVPPSERFVTGVTDLGLPLPYAFAWMAAIAEFAGGLLFAAGALSRVSALLIVITMTVAAFGRHAGDEFKLKELAILYLIVSIVFVCRGGGRFSVDRVLRAD